MFSCDLIRACLVFVIAFFLIDLKPIFPIYIAIFIVFSIGRFFVPAKMSIIPDLVKKGDLLLANSLVNTTGMIAAMFGLGLGGLLVSPTVLGVRGGFYLDAASFFVSAVLLFFISEKIRLKVNPEAIADLSKDIVEVIKKSVMHEIKDGLKFLVNNRNARYITSVLFVLGCVLGAVYVITIVFIQEILGSVTSQLGMLAIFLGVGLFCGSLLYGRFGQRLSQMIVIFIALALTGVMLFLFAFLTYVIREFWVAGVFAVFIGLTISPIMIASNTLIHKLSDSTMMGRVFSSLEVVMHFGFLLAMFLSASLAEVVGRIWILIYAGVIVFFIGIFGLAKELGHYAFAVRKQK